MNVLLSRNNYFRFGITYPTGRFYKDNWLRNHRNQAALIKSVSAILFGDSIIAGFLRYPNICYKFFDESTINCGIRGDKIQNVLSRVEKIPLPQSLEYVVISCGTNNLDTDDSEKIDDGLFFFFVLEKNEPCQSCNKWNSTSWWTKYGEKTEIIYSKRTAGKQVY